MKNLFFNKDSLLNTKRIYAIATTNGQLKDRQEMLQYAYDTCGMGIVYFILTNPLYVIT